MLPDPPRCPRCHTELPVDAPEGVCPACVLRVALDEAEETGPPSAESGEPPAPSDLARLFPQLEILEVLGRGGMGVVYGARQRRLDRMVALKTLPPGVGGDPAFAERFAREARALARLNHPGIVTVYDFGQVEGVYYFLMEYVDGTNLRDVIRRGSLRPEEALALVPRICEALQYAHEEGIVHRDIKPENILLDRRGRVKIADFGLAKLRLPAQGDPTLTGTQQVMGTPHYMAPEQWERPLAVDHRADIYSLGVVFYELLTGELPLGHFAPPSRKVRVDVRLDEVVLRALEKEPERRYQQSKSFEKLVLKVSFTTYRQGGATYHEESQALPVELTLWTVEGPSRTMIVELPGLQASYPTSPGSRRILVLDLEELLHFVQVEAKLDPKDPHVQAEAKEIITLLKRYARIGPSSRVEFEQTVHDRLTSFWGARTMGMTESPTPPITLIILVFVLLGLAFFIVTFRIRRWGFRRGQELLDAQEKVE